MKHCLPDPEAQESFGDYFTIFSCEYDSGKRSTGNEQIIRLGEDGKVMLLLCHSCLDQLFGQVLRDVVFEAIKNNTALVEQMVSKALTYPKGDQSKDG